MHMHVQAHNAGIGYASRMPVRAAFDASPTALTFGSALGSVALRFLFLYCESVLTEVPQCRTGPEICGWC